MNSTSTILELLDSNILQGNSVILSDVNMRVREGEFVFLIGKTGSGKSSFMKTLYGDLPLQEGEGEIVGHDLATLKESDVPSLRRKLGVVFQDFKLLPDRDVYDNLSFVLKATGWKEKKRIEKKIDSVLDKVGMNGSQYKFPHQMSGGEQQRVAIARALLNDPMLILADEPTGNLDPHTSVEIMNVLRHINETGRTILMATHDYSIISKFPSKTLKCDNGKIYEVIQKRQD